MLLLCLMESEKPAFITMQSVSKKSIVFWKFPLMLKKTTLFYMT